ncbi:MAG: cbb3-type cytochrome oxidase assembly protein CcoS [Cellvibrionaceae bacterium]|nr:cbb3-type cytochrome oxidase assembly protein CcoS [Cellvibrionaceae bacterium]
MQSLYFLIPLGLILLVTSIALLFWAITNGQYDDLDTEGERILFDDDPGRDNS